MVRKLSWVVVLGAGLVLNLSACGEGEEQVDERTEAELVGGKADIPSWLKPIPANWGCDSTLKGAFKGYDSAHLYSFEGKWGYEFTFTFKATYPKYLGAAIAVYDSETGKRVAYQRNPWSNAATVVYKAEKSIKYLVAVYSISTYATGTYTLGVACKRIFITCQGDFACDSGQFCMFDKGCGANNQLGVCTAKPGACIMLYKPVCGCDGKTYGNSCQAMSAGASVAAEGACAKKTQCELAGGYCTHFLTPCKSGFVSSWPMDCPLGRSGACCLPAVKLTTDKAGYMQGQPVVATLENATAASIFLGGCSVYSWQEEKNGVWVDLGPEKICVWEGIAGELKAAATHTESLATKGFGTYRVMAGYGIGCTPGKPLSQAGCTSTGNAYSDPIKVKNCPMLNMPNPNAFCPNGKMTPKYDTDGICISGYNCTPCVVADCGPAMGMPNTICPDGKTVAGPTGKCLATGWGTCAWEVISCPK